MIHINNHLTIRGWRSYYLINTLLNLPSFNIVYSSNNLYEFGDDFINFLKTQDKRAKVLSYRKGCDYICVAGPICFNKIDYNKLENNNYLVLCVKGLKKILNLRQLEKRFIFIGLYTIKFNNEFKFEIEDKENRLLLNYIFQNLSNKLSDKIYLTLRLMKEENYL